MTFLDILILFLFIGGVAGIWQEENDRRRREAEHKRWSACRGNYGRGTAKR